MEENLINLESDEKVLLKEQSNPTMVDKQYSRMILIGIILIIFWILSIISYKSEVNTATVGAIVTLFILTIAILYAFIYNTFLIKKRKNEVYYVTNKKIAVVSLNTTLEKNISDIEHIGISNEKNDYGNLTFNFNANSIYESVIKSMSFIGVHEPRKIVQTITQINDKIHVYDDKPKNNFIEK